jgi:hypothetical protein
VFDEFACLSFGMRNPQSPRGVRDESSPLEVDDQPRSQAALNV